MHTVGPGIWQGTEKGEKWNTSTVGPGILQVNWKTRKWDTNTLWPGIWREILKNIEKEKCTV